MRFFITILAMAIIITLPAITHAKIVARDGDVDNIVAALKQGNAEKLSQYFDNILDIKLPDKEEIKNIGKTQASLTLRAFFEQIDITGFDLSSQRDMGGTMYLAGKLQGGSKNYSVTLMMKNRSEKIAIITVRINE